MPTDTLDQLADVLFRDGVSTRTVATELSGRGIGLGVVRIECQKLGGRIELMSEYGRGTAVRCSIPAVALGNHTLEQAAITQSSAPPAPTPSTHGAAPQPST